MSEQSHPGVFIEESPGGVRSISGVDTCTTAAVGFTLKGAVNEAIHVSSFADFERHFPDVAAGSAIAEALKQYFLRGGREAWVVRSGSGTPSASLALLLYEPLEQSG